MAQLPLDEYVAEKTKDHAISVSGPEWNSFFASAVKTSRFIWLATSMSGQTMKNAGKLGQALKEAGVSWKEEVKSIFSISMPEGETAAGKLKTPGLRVLAVLFVLPLAALLAFTILFALKSY